MGSSFIIGRTVSHRPNGTGATSVPSTFTWRPVRYPANAATPARRWVWPHTKVDGVQRCAPRSMRSGRGRFGDALGAGPASTSPHRQVQVSAYFLGVLRHSRRQQVTHGDIASGSVSTPTMRTICGGTAVANHRTTSVMTCPDSLDHYLIPHQPRMRRGVVAGSMCGSRCVSACGGCWRSARYSRRSLKPASAGWAESSLRAALA